MTRSVLIVIAAVLSFATTCPATAQDAAPSDAALAAQPATAVLPAQVATSSQPAPPKKEAPVGAITGGYIYIASEVMPGSPWNFHLHGFYGIPQVNIKPWFGLFGDFTKSYNTSAGAHENTDSFLGGPIFTALSAKKISPFAFADAGKLRDSKNGTVTSSPVFATGGGLSVKLNKHVAVLFIPGEYIRAYPAMGSQLSSYSSRIGLTLPLYR